MPTLPDRTKAHPFKRQYCGYRVGQMRETIKALKDQEALPIVYETNEYTGLPIAHCPSCGEYLEQFHPGVYGKETKFCYYCGQEVKWE